MSNKITEQSFFQPHVSGSVEYIQLLSTGVKAYYDERVGHFVSADKRFHIDVKTAQNRSDMYIHYR